jgi:hypothetical protein
MDVVLKFLTVWWDHGAFSGDVEPGLTQRAPLPLSPWLPLSDLPAVSFLSPSTLGPSCLLLPSVFLMTTAISWASIASVDRGGGGGLSFCCPCRGRCKEGQSHVYTLWCLKVGQSGSCLHPRMTAQWHMWWWVGRGFFNMSNLGTKHMLVMKLKFFVGCLSLMSWGAGYGALHLHFSLDPAHYIEKPSWDSH